MKKLNCLIVVLLSTLCIVLTGCSSKDAETYESIIEDFLTEYQDAKTCESIVEDFLTAYQMLDSNAGNYLANRTEGIRFNGLQAQLAEQMTFSVEKAKKKDEGYLVTTQISTVDFKETFESVATSIDKTASEEEILDKLYDAIGAETPQIKTFSVEIPVQKYGKDYKIELTPELSNALFGGFNEYLSELTGGILNE